MMSETIPPQWSVLRPLTLVLSAQRNETMLTSVTRDPSSRRRALKAAPSQPHQCPYTACNPRALHSRGISYLLLSRRCSILSELFSVSNLHVANQSHAQPVHLRYAVLGLSAKRPSPSSRRSFPPGSARLNVPLHSFMTFLSSSKG